MTHAQPVYAFIKPTAPAAMAMERWQAQFGIGGGYDRERLHATLTPICDGRTLTHTTLAMLDRAVASLDAGPIGVVFDTLKRNMLVGGSGLRDLRTLQRALVRCLTAFGLVLPDYVFRPHVSLGYGDAPERIVGIAPIGWQVSEVLLVRSHHGQGRHELLRRWPLASRQMAFSF